MPHRASFSSAAANDRDSDSFRRLVKKEISPEEYVESLERRVRERREESEGGRAKDDDAEQ